MAGLARVQRGVWGPLSRWTLSCPGARGHTPPSAMLAVLVLDPSASASSGEHWGSCRALEGIWPSQEQWFLGSALERTFLLSLDSPFFLCFLLVATQPFSFHQLSECCECAICGRLWSSKGGCVFSTSQRCSCAFQGTKIRGLPSNYRF